MDADEILEQVDAAQAKRRSELPTERDALTAMWRAHERLRDFGWNDAKFCPKDGTFFHAIEAGSTGIHLCNYDGEWPKGRWWIYYEGDVYPARPILWRPIKERNNG